MSTEPFIGEIKLFGFNFAPKGYQTCSGQIISIATNTALFSLLGTTYGGNGQQTFGLPNLGGRVAVGQGQGPGLSNYVIGQISGTENVTLLTSNMPPHVHDATPIKIQFPASTSAEGSDPTGLYPGPSTGDLYGPAGNNTFLGQPVVSGTTGISGGGLPISVIQPYLAINYSIATQGIFPSRN